ncbi:NAD-dependent epimerase/dehydratase family protein [Pedobacter borealis]|uniref:NAD-dependent epimerase/dehydratase family protein n=1 Tax=Pedobacter borealis TaxID=475254 RepID=UPI0004934685|nr:NAD-dependent epimerase/dehydratase family protein [Pedobacter borealis]
MLKVLITGITGFLGSHLARVLSAAGIQVIGLKRVTSDTWRCQDFKGEVLWVDLDDQGNWEDRLRELAPSVMVHCAWSGVEAKQRESWTEQASNISFLIQLLEISKEVALSKFIFLGSQAEYGVLHAKVSEEQPIQPKGAYGAIKSASLQIVQTFCEENCINWVWLRVFSVFGAMEGDNWLIPSLVRRMKTEMEMDLTGGEQRYAYLYAPDFSAIVKVIIEQPILSGIYNISSNEVHSLKALLELIRDRVNSDFKLNFGVLPYRENQSMHIEGDISKLSAQIKLPNLANFEVALQKTIGYYTLNSNSK